MNQKKWLIITAIFVVGALSVALYRHIFNQRSVLEHSDQLTLYSLKPEADFYHDGGQAHHRSLEKFQEVTVLGKVQISDPILKKQLVDALFQSIEKGGGMAACFDPRHGLRAVRGGRTVDVVICFHCGAAYFYEGNGTRGCHVNSSTPKIFNRVLDDAKIPRSKPLH